MAVKLTGVNAQTLVEDATTLIDGVTFGKIVAMIVLEEAVLLAKQVPPVTLMVQLTISPLTSDVELYTFDDPFCTLIPFTLKL